MERKSIIPIVSLISLLSYVSAAFAQESPLGISEFIAGNIVLIGVLTILFAGFTGFIEWYIEQKGYAKVLGGPKIPMAAFALIIGLYVFGANVEAVQVAFPILGAFLVIIVFWYAAVVAFALLSQKLGKAEREQEESATKESEAVAGDLAASGVPGGNVFVKETTRQIDIIHKLEKIKELAIKMKAKKEIEGVRELLKSQEAGLRIGQIMALYVDIRLRIEDDDPLWGVIHNSYYVLAKEKFDKDVADTAALKGIINGLKAKITGEKTALNTAGKGKGEEKKILDQTEKELLEAEKVLQEIYGEEALLKAEQNLDKLAQQAVDRNEKRWERVEEGSAKRGGELEG